MDRRRLCVGLVVLASCFLMLGGTAFARGAEEEESVVGTGKCLVKSLPSFIAQGEFYYAATVGDVIEVSCDPYTYSQGARVEVVASQLFDRCNHYVSWYKPNEEGEDEVTTGRSVSLRLDVNGNANVGLIAGPKCMVGSSLISVDETEAPYETYTTAFEVLPAVNTTPGLTMEPSHQVEDQESSGVVTIAEAEFAKASEEKVRIGAGQLFDRCQRDDHLIIVKSNRGEYDNVSELLDAIELDNNGNGFVLLMGADSCAEGSSLIEADLESSPFTTYESHFLVEAPKPR